MAESRRRRFHLGWPGKVAGVRALALTDKEFEAEKAALLRPGG